MRPAPDRLWRLGPLALLWLLVPGVMPAAPARGPSLVVATGARQAGDLVVTRRDVVVDGVLDGTFVAIGGTSTIAGRVTGDVILMGGTAVVRGAGRIEGNLLAVGAGTRFEEGASPERAVGGRVVSVAALEAAFLAELRTSPLASRSLSPLLLSFRLAILTVWLALGLGLLFAGPRRLSRAAGYVAGRMPFLAAVGTSAVLSALLLSALLLALAPARAAVPLVGLVVVLLLGAKVFGLAALFVVLGRRLARGVPRSSALFGDPAALSLGLLALGLLSLVPAAGAVLWAIASLVGIGLALRTSFGRTADEAG